MSIFQNGLTMSSHQLGTVPSQITLTSLPKKIPPPPPPKRSDTTKLQSVIYFLSLSSVIFS